MTAHAPPDFEALERRSQRFAHGLLKRKACPCCVSRALLFAAVELGYETDNVLAVQDMLQSLLTASVNDMQQHIAH